MIASRLLPMLGVACVFACGGATPAPTSTAPTAATTTAARPATTPDTAATDTPKPADAAKGGLTEEKLRAAKSLSEPFPKVDEVIKEIGAPTAQGTAPRREWYFDKAGSGRMLHCDTVDVIKGPYGAAIFDKSVYTSSACAKITATSKKLLTTLAALGSGDEKHILSALDAVADKKKPFDEVAAAFEKALGKPQESGEPAFSAWKYTNEDGECRMLVITSSLGSQAPQALWDARCD